MQQLSGDIFRHVPGVQSVLMANGQATVQYRSGKAVTLTAPPAELPALVLAWLVPVQYSGEFSTLLDFNRAMDGLHEATDVLTAATDMLTAA